MTKHMSAVPLRGVDSPVRDLPTAIKETGKSPLTDLEHEMVKTLTDCLDHIGTMPTELILRIEGLVERAKTQGR